MKQTSALIRQLLGCSLQEITRSYWAVKLDRGFDTFEWVSEARSSFDFRRGSYTPIDWMDDIAATGDSDHIVEIWLLCPPSQTSPLGNTARLPITRPGSAFQLKIATNDAPLAGPGVRTQQAHLIGRVENEAGDCTCFVWDSVLGGLLTPETMLHDPLTWHIVTNENGTPYYPLKTNVNHFGQRLVGGKLVNAMWRPSLAPLGQLALDRMGVRL